MKRRWIVAGVLGAVITLVGSAVTVQAALAHRDSVGWIGRRAGNRISQPVDVPTEPDQTEPDESEPNDTEPNDTGPESGDEAVADASPKPDPSDEPGQAPSSPAEGERGEPGPAVRDPGGPEGPAPQNPPADPGALPIRRIATEGREVVITFDDGPSPYTEQILAILREEQVPAAFFWIAGQQRPDLARQVCLEGHQLGSHTVSHARLTNLTGPGQRSEIRQSLDLLEQAAQVPVWYVRPPFGAYNAETLAIAREMGLQVILWDVDSRDWELANDPDRIISNVMSQVRPGSIILLHERKQTVQVLRDLLQALRDAGYTFRLLPGAEGTEAPALQWAPPAPVGADQGAPEAEPPGNPGSAGPSDGGTPDTGQLSTSEAAPPPAAGSDRSH